MPRAADPIDRESSRPNANVRAYPVITLQPPFAKTGSRNSLLGENYGELKAASMSTHLLVTPSTPATFLFHPIEDGPVEAHFFDKGRHGVGLSPDDAHLSQCMPLALSWLRTIGR